MDLQNTAGIDAWIVERSRENIAKFERGDIPFAAFSANAKRTLEFARIMYQRLDATNRPIKLKAVK